MQISPTETKLVNKVSKWKEPYKTLGITLHELIKKTKPELMPSFMYGMPAYRLADSKGLVCFFRHDEYLTFGLLEHAKVEFSPGVGSMQPTSWFIKEFNDAVIDQLTKILNSIV